MCSCWKPVVTASSRLQELCAARPPYGEPGLASIREPTGFACSGENSFVGVLRAELWFPGASLSEEHSSGRECDFKSSCAVEEGNMKIGCWLLTVVVVVLTTNTSFGDGEDIPESTDGLKGGDWSLFLLSLRNLAADFTASLASSGLWTKWHRGPYGQNPVEWKVRHNSVLYFGCLTSVLISSTPWANWQRSPYLHVPLSWNGLHSSVLYLLPVKFTCCCSVAFFSKSLFFPEAPSSGDDLLEILCRYGDGGCCCGDIALLPADTERGLNGAETTVVGREWFKLPARVRHLCWCSWSLVKWSEYICKVKKKKPRVKHVSCKQLEYNRFANIQLNYQADLIVKSTVHSNNVGCKGVTSYFANFQEFARSRLTLLPTRANFHNLHRIPHNCITSLI